MSLLLSLDTDHTRFRIELPSGAHVTVPCTDGGMAQLRRLLLAEKLAQLNLDEKLARGANIAQATLDAWAVGQPASPTQQEIDHIAQHESFAQGCPFCRDEARRGARAPVTVSDFD